MNDSLMSTKVAMKLCGQWHEGIEHISNEYLETKSEYQIEDSVGVVTRCLNEKQLQEDVERYQQRISNSGNENKESSDTIVLTIDEHDALVYGTTKTNDVAPKVVNDRTMLPARFIAENLGATVEWDGEKQLVTITGKNEKQEDVTILITIGSDYAKVNGEDVKLDSPAFVENDRTYTPIRFISENLGATVEWNETEHTVTIQRVK